VWGGFGSGISAFSVHHSFVFFKPPSSITFFFTFFSKENNILLTMLSVENITGVLESLKLEKKSLESQDFSSAVVSHVQAEPKVLDKVMPQLLEQVWDVGTEYSW
jgi:hypothetical protein